MVLSDKAKLVLTNRISRRDSDGNPYESPADIFERVDTALEGNGEYYDLMTSQRFMPNSPTLVNAGTPNGQLSACFVLPVGDSIDEIYDSVKNAAKIHKTGGGTGFSFSHLRPEGSIVRSTGGVASGPVSFMKVFDASTMAIKQGGVRRGANMGILNVHHPDILDFINMKSDNETLQNFNISVAVTDDFMEALQYGGNYRLYNVHTQGNMELPAQEVWEAITENAWKTGDPGVIFVDKVNRSRANPLLGRYIEATNPCGEQPLYDYDSCNLGSLNVAKYIDSRGVIDKKQLAEDVGTAVKFLNSVIDHNTYPLDEIAGRTKNIRRIGLGVMGWADALINARIPYGSKESVELAKDLMSFIQTVADKHSSEMGRFPMFNDSIYASGASGYLNMYNSTRTTIAPTGTISMIADCSSGIEPVFDFAFKRSHYLDPSNPNERYEFIDTHPVLSELYYDNDIENYVDRGIGLPGRPDYLIKAGDLHWSSHVAMQAAFQEWTDNAVSKTINMHSDADVGSIDEAYRRAYDIGCLGITVYRDGSKEQQVLSRTSAPKETVMINTRNYTKESLPSERESITHKVVFAFDKSEYYITAGKYPDGSIGEVFIIGNKAGSTTRGYLDTVGTLISMNLQQGMPVSKLVERFSGVKYEPSGFTSNPNIPTCTSLIDYVVRWLETLDGKTNETSKEPNGDLCPECDGSMYYAEGCSNCRSCGYSKCG